MYEITYPFSNFNGATVEIYRMGKLLHPSIFNGCNYLFVQGLKLIHFRKRGPWHVHVMYQHDLQLDHIAKINWWTSKRCFIVTLTNSHDKLLWPHRECHRVAWQTALGISLNDSPEVDVIPVYSTEGRLSSAAKINYFNNVQYQWILLNYEVMYLIKLHIRICRVSQLKISVTEVAM